MHPSLQALAANTTHESGAHHSFNSSDNIPEDKQPGIHGIFTGESREFHSPSSSNITLWHARHPHRPGYLYS
jgi:hypothetical protein